jgi:hypothetical protein
VPGSGIRYPGKLFLTRKGFPRGGSHFFNPPLGCSFSWSQAVPTATGEPVVEKGRRAFLHGKNRERIRRHPFPDNPHRSIFLPCREQGTGHSVLLAGSTYPILVQAFLAFTLTAGRAGRGHAAFNVFYAAGRTIEHSLLLLDVPLGQQNHQNQLSIILQSKNYPKFFNSFGLFARKVAGFHLAAEKVPVKANTKRWPL